MRLPMKGIQKMKSMAKKGMNQGCATLKRGRRMLTH